MKRYKSVKKHGKPKGPHPENGFERGRVLFALMRLEKLREYCESMAGAETGNESVVWKFYADAIGTVAGFAEERL